MDLLIGVGWWVGVAMILWFRVQARTVRRFESVDDNEGFANLCGRPAWNTVCQ
jgi:hypothetical protein